MDNIKMAGFAILMVWIAFIIFTFFISAVIIFLVFGFLLVVYISIEDLFLELKQKNQTLSKV